MAIRNVFVSFDNRKVVTKNNLHCNDDINVRNSENASLPQICLLIFFVKTAHYLT